MDLEPVSACRKSRAGHGVCGPPTAAGWNRRIRRGFGDHLQEELGTHYGPDLCAPGRSGTGRHFGDDRVALPRDPDAGGRAHVWNPCGFAARVSSGDHQGYRQLSAGRRCGDGWDCAVLYRNDDHGILWCSLPVGIWCGAIGNRDQRVCRDCGGAEPGAGFRFDRAWSPDGSTEVHGVVWRVCAHDHADLAVPGDFTVTPETSEPQLRQSKGDLPESLAALVRVFL